MADPFAVATAALFANQVAASLGNETGKGLWAGLDSLVRRKLKPELKGKTALARVETAPQDEAAVRALAELLEIHFSSDNAFREEIVQLLTNFPRRSSAGELVAVALGDAKVGKITQIKTVKGNVSF